MTGGAPLLGFTLIAALATLPLPSTGQSLPPVQCQNAPGPVAFYDPAAARDSFPILVRNTFTSDGTAPDLLGVAVLFPPDPSGECPDGTIETLLNIRALGDGLFEGIVAADASGPNGHLAGVAFTFDTTQIWDWQLRTPNTDGRFFGAYRLRAFAATASNGGAALLQLMPDPLPADWN
jgi:hypothetical protein